MDKTLSKPTLALSCKRKHESLAENLNQGSCLAVTCDR